MADKGELGQRAFVVVGPSGVAYVGFHASEADAWSIALGWPSDDEIDALKQAGWYAAEATLTWTKPGTQSHTGGRE